MAEKENFILRSAKLFDIPLDVVVGAPHLEVCGTNQAIIENHKGILEYEENLLSVNLGTHTLEIRGKELNITSMNELGLKINGHIESISFESV